MDHFQDSAKGPEPACADAQVHPKRTCVLVGQPTLRRRIRLGAFAALDQRVALRYSMTGMEPAETADYVAHPPKDRRVL